MEKPRQNLDDLGGYLYDLRKSVDEDPPELSEIAGLIQTLISAQMMLIGEVQGPTRESRTP